MPPQNKHLTTPITKKISTLRAIRDKVKNSDAAKALDKKIDAFTRRLSAGTRGLAGLTNTSTPKAGEEAPKSDFAWKLRANQSQRPPTK